MKQNYKRENANLRYCEDSMIVIVEMIASMLSMIAEIWYS